MYIVRPANIQFKIIYFSVFSLSTCVVLCIVYALLFLFLIFFDIWTRDNYESMQTCINGNGHAMLCLSIFCIVACPKLHVVGFSLCPLWELEISHCFAPCAVLNQGFYDFMLSNKSNIQICSEKDGAYQKAALKRLKVNYQATPS